MSPLHTVHEGMLLCPAVIEAPLAKATLAEHMQLPVSTPCVCIISDVAEVSKCCCDAQVGPAKQIGLDGDEFPLLQAHTVDGAQSTAGLRKHARLVCEWGQHPMTLLLAAGLSIVLC